MKFAPFTFTALFMIPALAVAQDTMPAPSPVPHRADRSNEFSAAAAPDRVTYSVPAAQAGTSRMIPMADIVRLCADMDGCSVRLGMYNWDGTGRTASRDFLFYYNPNTKGHRASMVVPIAPGFNLSQEGQGFDVNGTVEHDAQAWACYFTDGEYSNWNGTDLVPGFNLLLWNQNRADCWITIIE